MSGPSSRHDDAAAQVHELNPDPEADAEAWLHAEYERGYSEGRTAAEQHRLDNRPPLDSVGIVCVCGRALATIEGAARRCECGRIWLVTAMQIGGPRA